MQKEKTVIRWIIGIFIIFDSVYQLYGVSQAVGWSIYYELIHYGVLFIISLYFSYRNWDRLLFCLSLYFLFVLVAIITHIGMNRADYLNAVNTDELYFYSILPIILLIVFIIYKKKKQ